MTALYTMVKPHGHVVAQIIKTEFGISAVGNVRRVRLDSIHQPQMILIFVRRFFLEINQECLLTILSDGGHLQNADR